MTIASYIYAYIYQKSLLVLLAWQIYIIQYIHIDHHTNYGNIL